LNKSQTFQVAECPEVDAVASVIPTLTSRMASIGTAAVDALLGYRDGKEPTVVDSPQGRAGLSGKPGSCRRSD
jgi:hypothetical protein